MPTVSDGKSRGFRVATVVAQGFTIRGETAYLTGRMEEADGDYRFDGVLFSEPENIEPTLMRNFPEGPAPDGWYKRALEGHVGYELVNDETGEAIFGFRIVDRICQVTTSIYDVDGPLALALDGDLIMSGGSIVLSDERGS